SRGWAKTPKIGFIDVEFYLAYVFRVLLVVPLLLINIFISLSVLFFLIYLMNKIGQRLKALETYRLINLLEYMNDELPISQNCYLFLTESHDVYFYLDNMVFDISKVYRLRNKKYFSFDKKWERKIINGIIQKM